MDDSEYEYYTEDEDDEVEIPVAKLAAADVTENEQVEPHPPPIVAVKAWRKKFDAELDCDSGRESLTENSCDEEPEVGACGDGGAPPIRETTQLHYAVLDNDIHKVNSLLDAGADANAQDENGLTGQAFITSQQKLSFMSYIYYLPI